MSQLHFDQFQDAPSPVAPFHEIGEGIKICYDASALKRFAIVTVRKSMGYDETGRSAPYLIMDGNNFAQENWAGLEIALPDQAAQIALRLRAYPAQELAQRIYFTRNQVDHYIDLVPVTASDSFFTILHHRQDLIRAAGLPQDATDLRLNLFIAPSDWFAIGLMSVRLSR